MMDYAGLEAVAAVVREGSFDKAAKALGITPSAISQRVKALEERLGSILILRGQPCMATIEGLRICRHIDEVRMLEEELRLTLPALPPPRGPHERVTLPLAVNADSLATWFLAAATKAFERTGYLFDLLIDDEAHTAELLRSGRAIGAVTTHAEPVQGFRSFALGDMRYHAVATPAFVRQWFPQGITAHALALAPAFVFNRKDCLQHEWVKQVTGQHIDMPSHWLPSSQAFIDASLLGMGWGMSPIGLLKHHIESGALIDLSPDHVVKVPLYWQVRSLAIRQLQELTEIVLASARSSTNGI